MGMKAMEKGQIIEIRIEDMLDDGRAFGRYDGCAVFISGSAVPGDRVSAEDTTAVLFSSAEVRCRGTESRLR